MESAVVLQQAPQAGTGQCPHGPIRERGIYLAKSGITRFSIRVVHTSGRPLMKALSWRWAAALIDFAQGQEGGRAEDVGADVVAGCKTPPVLQSGKEHLDFATPGIQPLVVMDWLLAAATGRDARRDALPGQHLAGSVPLIPLTPNHRTSRWQVLEHPIITSEVTALPLT